MDLLPFPRGKPCSTTLATFCPRKAVPYLYQCPEFILKHSKQLWAGQLLSACASVPRCWMVTQYLPGGLLFLERANALFQMYSRKLNTLSLWNSGDSHTTEPSLNPKHCSLFHSLPLALTSLSEKDSNPSAVLQLFFLPVLIPEIRICHISPLKMGRLFS